MELTKEQLKNLNDYLWSCGIKYYDVRAEIVDHFAFKLEYKLIERPNLDFKKEIIKLHKEFGKNGFKDFLKQQKKAVKKKFYRLTLKHFNTFFRMPKIIISVGFFYALVYLLGLHGNPKEFFSIVNDVFLFIVIQFAIRMKFSAYEDKFLVLSRIENMFWLVYASYFLILEPIRTFRSTLSYENSIYNYLQIGLVVFLLLIYWCSEYVFYQNKKEIQKQYPNILVY